MEADGHASPRPEGCAGKSEWRMYEQAAADCAFRVFTCKDVLTALGLVLQ